MNLAPTELNQRLAEALQKRIDSENFQIARKAGFWRLLGLGLIALGIGSSLGAGFYGYSFVLRNSTNIEMLTIAMSTALSDVRLRAVAEGTVHLDPSEIAL